jgi:Flp pilus assembly protein TadG
MAALNSIRRRWKLASGQELIEFALVLPLLLLVLLGIIEFGLLFQQYEVVTNAAREGARIAVLPTYTKADALTRINQYLTAARLDPGLATSNVGNPVANPIGGNCMFTVKVDVSYPHGILFVGGIASYFGGVFPGTVNLTATSTMRTEAASGACP